MELAHSFSVPTSVEETWAHFQDIAEVAQCFPGAQVTSVEGDTFQGTVKVKLGPIALQYNGSGTFVEKDDAAHRFVVVAKGKDRRGNGTAGATVTLTMSEAGSGTAVEVLTDLAITGKPAQFGRGVMQDVSDKLLGQFVTCLESRLAAPAPSEDAEPAPEAAAGAAALADAATGSAAAGTGVAESQVAGSAGSGGGTPGADSAVPAPPPAPPRASAPPPRGSDDAVDLGAAVLPVLVKSYGKQALATLAVVLLVWRLLRRR